MKAAYPVSKRKPGPVKFQLAGDDTAKLGSERGIFLRASVRAAWK